jgi:cytochrome c5
MRQLAILIFLPMSAAMPLVVASCSSSSDATDSAADAGLEQGPAGTGLATGLPCDVQAVIENRCIACHDGTGAPPKLLDFATLVAPSTKDPAKSRALVAVELMRGGAMPPRPAVGPADDEIASFEDWVNNGTYREPTACTTPPPRTPSQVPDAGTSSGGGDASAPGECTSGQRWTQANQGSPLMHPGTACNACHQVSGGPNLRLAGTIYPTAHEPNDCNGVAPPLTVIVTDSRGTTFTMPVNAAGNFLLPQQGGKPPRAPFKARITDGTKERAMQGSVTSGDCNSCHTTTGVNGAPGRIMAP